METSSFAPIAERARLVAFLDAHPDHRNKQLGQAFKKEWVVTAAAKLKAFEKMKAKKSAADCDFIAHVCGYVNAVQLLIRTSTTPLLPGFLPSGMSLLGPHFIPSFQSRFAQLYNSNFPNDPPTYSTFTLRPVNVVHLLYYPDLRRCPGCGGTVKTKGWSTGFREVTGVFHHEHAIGGIIACTATCLKTASEIAKCETAGDSDAMAAYLDMQQTGEEGGAPYDTKCKARRRAKP